jgi:hypothetical protein
MFCKLISYLRPVFLHSGVYMYITLVIIFASPLRQGRAAFASLTHWCYNIVDDRSDDKCYISSCPNYLGDALKGGKATDVNLKDALISQKKCAVATGKKSYVINRLQDEINYLGG